MHFVCDNNALSAKSSRFQERKRGCAGRKKMNLRPRHRGNDRCPSDCQNRTVISGITTGNFSSPPDNQRKNYRFLIAFCRAFFWNFPEKEFSIIPFLSWSAPENGLFFFRKPGPDIALFSFFFFSIWQAAKKFRFALYLSCGFVWAKQRNSLEYKGL